MKHSARAWLYAIFMGILLPGLIFSVAEKCIPHRESNNPADLMTEPTETQTNHQENTTILVIQADGSGAEMDMNSYLIGVLLGEMPTDFDEEALKAQAVVARTYACKRQATGNKHISGGVCMNSTCCQSYRSISSFLASGGTQQAVDKVSKAVNATTGEILMYKGQLIEATYFSCSGGRTEDALAVWGTDIPYLQAVDSPGEENAAHYFDQVTFTAAEFASRLGISPGGNPISWLGAVTYTDGGGVDTMVIDGKLFSGTTLREKLGLRSTVITMIPVGNKIHVSTKGFGHRVGMSQYGAEAMAVKGKTYKEILAYYYPGTVLSIN